MCYVWLCWPWWWGGFPRERLHVPYSSCTLWVSSCDIPLPSVYTGTLVSPGFPMGEAQTGRMYSTEEDHVSKYIHVLCCPLLSLLLAVQVLWVEQLHRLVLEPIL